MKLSCLTKEEWESTSIDSIREAYLNMSKKYAVTPIEQMYKTTLNKIYTGLFHMVSDKLEDYADMLAKNLVEDPHTTFDTLVRGSIVTVETEIFADTATEKDFVELLAKVADLRKKIVSVDPCCEEILYIKRTKPNEDDKECVSIMLEDEWGDRFATLISAIESIDKYIEHVGNDKGMSCERICPLRDCKAHFDVSLSKSGIVRVKVGLKYALRKVRYELNDQARQSITDAVDAQKRKDDPQQ